MFTKTEILDLLHPLEKPSPLAFLNDPEGYKKAIEEWKTKVGWRRIFRGKDGGPKL